MDSSMLGNGQCRRYVVPFSIIPIIWREDGSMEKCRDSSMEPFKSDEKELTTCPHNQALTSSTNKQICQQQMTVDNQSEISYENLTILKFASFQICLKSSDPRVPTKESKAEIELCSKSLHNGTKTLHFLKVVFPVSGARFAAQVLPPWRSEAGIKMARMGGVAVFTKSPLDLHRRRGRVVKRRNQSTRK